MTGADVEEVAHAIGTDKRIGSNFLKASVGKYLFIGGGGHIFGMKEHIFGLRLYLTAYIYVWDVV